MFKNRTLDLIFNYFFGFNIHNWFWLFSEARISRKYKTGWASKTALFLSEIPSNAIKLFSQNKTYVEDRHKNLKQGFNIYQSNEINGPKYLLLSRWDADSNDGIVELVDIHEFKVLHVWNPNISEFYKKILIRRISY